MGLNFKQSNASWSYSGFNAFRTRLAAEAGVGLRDMVGFGGLKPWDSVADDIVPLLNHSDCEGSMSPHDCLKVAPRIRQLVQEWDDDYDRRNALELADDMERVGKLGEHLIFT